MQIAITNNEERVRQIRLRSKNPSSKGATVQIGPLIMLPPGITMLDKATWDEAKENPNVGLLLKTPIAASPAPEANPERVGRMILVEGPVVKDGNPLKEMSLKDAQGIIVETLDTALLRSWLTDESRGEVRKAIERQIATVEAPKNNDHGAKAPRARTSAE